MSAISRPSDPTVPSSDDDLAAKGFRPFKEAESKGHAFTIWLKPPANAGRTAWKAAVMSRGTLSLATAYVADDGVLRACVSIADPRGYQVFRAETRRSALAGGGFQCEFGAG